MLQAEIAAATGTARSKWWDAHSDATQATVKNLKLQWKFSAKYPQFPNGDSYDQVSMLPRTHEYWNDLATQNCIAALQKGHLVAVAWEPDLAKEHHSDASSSAYKTASSTSSRNGAENDRSNYRPRSDTPATVETIESPAKGYRDRIMSRHYQRVMERLRTLIKNATGYSFRSKQNTHLLYDNPSGKGAYKWNFSDKFRRFPQNAPSKWTTAHCRLVEEALHRNWLSVTPLPDTRDSDSPTPSLNNRPLRATTTAQRPTPSQPTPLISTAPNPDDGQTEDPIPALLAALNRDLTSAYDRTVTSLTTTLLASATSHHTFLSSSLARISTALASQRSTDHSSEVARLKQQIATAQSDDAREAELAQARTEGDVAGQQRAIREIGDVQDGLLRSHLQELMRVRREARMEGYEAGFRAGVEQGRERDGMGESGLMGEGLGESYEEGEEGNLESEVGILGGLGVGRGGGAVGSGENRGPVSERGGGGYIPESEFHLQPHPPGVIGGRRPDSSDLKHPFYDDGELYNATPPRATKALKIERPDSSMGIQGEVRGNTENRLILHKGSSEGLAQSFSGGLFMSSDEEIDEGTRDVFGKDGDIGFSYF
ncbi:hypothetical protein VE01_06466 [Pseudogymnoascus verrucosus]|uniref:Uncharacterized protein n=1 Tax=Pseudogymnoascus verrucosus TaxID=342668 RepID=A0A1B8GIY1_9PEZI|nr:uncharacterized protein VE01_06466 [Pseudogymnoascus verrucosus]OBT95800.1 hypothetical protein VE01_06466 [Pseudogymnoascus verrucosus]